MRITPGVLFKNLTFQLHDCFDSSSGQCQFQTIGQTHTHIIQTSGLNIQVVHKIRAMNPNETFLKELVFKIFQRMRTCISSSTPEAKMGVVFISLQQNDIIGGYLYTFLTINY